MQQGRHGTLLVVPIEEIRDVTAENAKTPVKAISIKAPAIAQEASPGQFVMMWLYGLDEKPMGIATKDTDTGLLSFAIAKVGPTTKALHQLKKGDLIGIRGPYGKGFTLQGNNIAIIGGGTGIAPARFLTEEALKQNLEVTLIHGAKTKSELAFLEFFEGLAKERANFTYLPATDDGSYGFKGFATNCLQANYSKDWVSLYTCGPEQMMFKVFQQAKNWRLPLEACLADRYFKCAIGLCGQCSLDPLGIRLCIDGPVLPLETLEKLTDFGKYGRDKFGQKYKL